jgi:hypothetical protein
MFCRNCGAQNNVADQFCSSCGARHESGNISAPKRPKSRLGAWIIGVLAIIFLIAALAHTDSGTDVSYSESNSGPSQQVSNVVHKLNETVTVGEWSYKVTGVRWANSIGSDYAREYPDAKFLIIDLLIRNNDRTASALAPLKLVDSEGRQYDESDKSLFLDGSFGLLKNVNPGVTSRGFVLFDVPPGNYSLLVSGGFTSGKTTKIELE